MKKITNSAYRVEIEKELSRAVSYEQRAQAILFFQNNPALSTELLEICFQATNPLSAKACRMLELVCMQNLHYLSPHLNLFFTQISDLKKDAEIRPAARICEHLMIAYYQESDILIRQKVNNSHRQKLTEVCFDWLISKQKVATKAHAMTCLYYLGTEFEWINPELKIILTQNYLSGSAAYKARARMVLKKIDR